MALIDKQNVITQLSSQLSSLDIPNEEIENIVFWLKTAFNAELDTSAILLEIEDRVQSIDVSDTLKESIFLIIGLSLSTTNRIIYVPNREALETLTNVFPGTIVFVEDRNKPYIKRSNSTWILIDPATNKEDLENIWAWGNNDQGRLGDKTVTDRSSPVSAVGGFNEWIQVSAGVVHTLGLRVNGSAWAWGSNNFGRLGDNTTIAKSSPVSVIGDFLDWVQVSTGNVHSLGLRAGGSAWAWGGNSFGQLGDGTTITKSSPVSVAGDFDDWTHISAGNEHSLGLRADGSAWAWGNNANGRLGDDSTTNRSSPVSVVGGFADWIQVSAGASTSNAHSLGVRAGGSAWAWGSNASGQLGDHSTTNRSSPVSVVGGFLDWVQVSAGGAHSIGLRAGGSAWAWGSNSNGRLGDGTTTTKSSPIPVVGGFSDWVQVSAGDAHSVALRANGSAWAWGLATNGRIGDGSTTDKSSPVSVLGEFLDWVQVSAGNSHTAGVRGG